MAAPLSEVTAFLADDESVLVSEVPGTLVTGSQRSVGAISMTDRRMLFQSDEDEFVDIAHHAIVAIQSHPRTTYTARGIGYRLLVVAGGLVAIGGILGVSAFDPGVAGGVLLAMVFTGAVASVFVRRHDGTIEGTRLDALSGPLRRHDIGKRVGRLGGREPVDNDEIVVLSLGILAISSAIGLVVITQTPLVIAPILVALGGIALIDYGNRQRRNLDALGGSRRRDHMITIHLAGGETLLFRVDASDRIDRELSGIVRGDRSSVGTVELAEP